jgi:hypothetical protein
MRSALVGTLFGGSVLCACGGLVVFDTDGSDGGIDDGLGNEQIEAQNFELGCAF